MTATIGGVAPALDQSPVLEAVDERDEIARMHAQGGGELRLGGGVLLGERVEQRVLVGLHVERGESGADLSAGGAPETEHEEAARRRLRWVALIPARGRPRVRRGTTASRSPSEAARCPSGGASGGHHAATDARA